MDQENSERTAEDKALNDRLDKEISDREAACNQLQARYSVKSSKTSNTFAKYDDAPKY